MATDGSISLAPGNQNGSEKPWLVFRLDAGQTQTGIVRITNLSNKNVSAFLYPVDARLTPHGDLGMLSMSSPRTEVGSWMKLSQDLVELAPHQSILVDYRLNIPKNTAIGQYYGGVILQPLSAQTKNQKGFTTQLITRIGLRVYETVPGIPRPALKLRDVRITHIGENIRVNASLINAGNTMLNPSATIITRPLFGKSSTILQSVPPLQPWHATTLSTSIPIQQFIWQPYAISISINQIGSKESPLAFTKTYVWAGGMMPIVTTLTIVVLVSFVILNRRSLKLYKLR